MKTKLSYLVLLSMVILFGFNSCSNDKETESEDQTKPKSVFLKLGKSSTSTRSEGVPIASGTEVILESGDVYFVNASGAILKHYTVTNSPSNATNINITEAQTGASISNLPGSTEAIYIVGNTSGLPTFGNITSVQASLLQVASQGDIEKINLYGTGILVDPISPSTVYTCEVTLAPTVARIELTNITASGVITDFKVDGIFIDNYYKQASVAGSVNISNFVENGAVASIFNNLSTQYPLELKPVIYDFYSPALSANTKIAKPAGTGTVWGYNLFATSAGSTVPRIVIRLSDIVTNDGSLYANPQFVTVRGFKTASNGTSLASIKSGNIYNITAGALTFKETDLSPIPNLSPIDVEVTINLVTWTVVGITPEL